MLLGFITAGIVCVALFCIFSHFAMKSVYRRRAKEQKDFIAKMDRESKRIGVREFSTGFRYWVLNHRPHINYSKEYDGYENDDTNSIIDMFELLDLTREFITWEIDKMANQTKNTPRRRRQKNVDREYHREYKDAG